MTKYSMYSMRSALIVCLVLLVSACGGSGTPATNTPVAASTPATVPTAAPVATAVATAAVKPSAVAQATNPAPTATATVAGSGQSLAISSLSTGLQSLKSYRLHMLFNIDVKDNRGNRQQGTLDISEFVDNAGRALHRQTKAGGNLNSGYGVPGDVSELYHLDGTTFLVDNGKCRFLSKKPYSGLAGSMILPDDYINSIGSGALAGRGETVNGVSADHYTFTTGALGRQLQGMAIARGDVWLATDGYVVRLTGQAMGADQFGGSGAVTANYDVDSINQPLGIKAPADCVAP